MDVKEQHLDWRCWFGLPWVVRLVTATNSSRSAGVLRRRSIKPRPLTARMLRFQDRGTVAILAERGVTILID